MENQVDELLKRAPGVINIGVQDFAESLQAQAAQVIHIDWSPPVEGDQEMLDLLDRLL